VNWLQLVLVILCAPLLICGLYWTISAVVDALHRVDETDTPSPRCDCGRVSLGVFTHAHTPDHVTHTPELCQPCREVL